MISEDDKVAVGLSGGKDSMALLILLNNLRKYFDINFKLGAITLDLGFNNFSTSNIEAICVELNIPLHIEKTKISKIVFDIKNSKNPCGLCSNLRRGALNNIAKKLGYNKVALGHNMDDVIQTFYISMLYEGSLSLFAPKTYLTRIELDIIRPMIYIEENETRELIKNSNHIITTNPCSSDGYTKRQYVKELLEELYEKESFFKKNIFNSIKKSNIAGW